MDRRVVDKRTARFPYTRLVDNALIEIEVRHHERELGLRPVADPHTSGLTTADVPAFGIPVLGSGLLPGVAALVEAHQILSVI